MKVEELAAVLGIRHRPISSGVGRKLSDKYDACSTRHSRHNIDNVLDPEAKVSRELGILVSRLANGQRA